MASSIPLQVAETIQTAHINKDPSAEHDINPSTATSKREPVILEKQETQPEGQPLSPQEEEIGESSETTTSTKTSRQQQHTTLFQQSLRSHSRTIPTPGGFDDEEEEEEDIGDDIDIDEDEEDQEEEGHIPFSILRAKPRGAGVGASRKHHLPPIPDLRYEQSYLHSIRDADTWWKVVLITARDQVMMPFAQGILYNLAICGWQFWNRDARVHGSSVGARLRRWWYGVNNWPIPPAPTGAPSRSSVFRSNFSNSRCGK